MKTTTMILILAGTMCLGTASAEAQRPSSRSEFFKKFDKNSDGKIDEEERKAIRAAYESRFRGNSSSKSPSDASDSKKKEAPKTDAKKPEHSARSSSTRPSGPPWASRGGSNWHSDFMKKYDKNKNGKIDDDERNAIREAFASRFRGNSSSRASDSSKKEAPKKPEHHARSSSTRPSGPPWASRGGSSGHSDFMKKYDKNKNGKIDDDERKAIHEAFASRFRGSTSGHGPSRASDSSKKEAPKTDAKKPGHGHGHHGRQDTTNRGSGHGHKASGHDQHRRHHESHGHHGQSSRGSSHHRGPHDRGSHRGHDHRSSHHGDSKSRSSGDHGQSSHRREMLNRIFDHFDTNKDGKIEKAEVEKKADEIHNKIQQRYRGSRSGDK